MVQALSPANSRARSLPASDCCNTCDPSATTDHVPPDFDHPLVPPDSKSAENSVAA
ncbi:hypothetical protein Ade02nite_11010 [Paractinoplanes deccanensis]|uniref:Uncharacterized protein n=1 Tax=Paractinoplanes deccanensis TaxID=113561 RepID=A0ABQ3XXJ4_9ACTN|nr:hypothetical protein Ade02nite_11010 [Actinoplanes deccanensis]